MDLPLALPSASRPVLTSVPQEASSGVGAWALAPAVRLVGLWPLALRLTLARWPERR